ncbi:unnamed protein product [Rhodiola kirilowii]
MNDEDVTQQIQQMVRFIRQEAEEKAMRSPSPPRRSSTLRSCSLLRRRRRRSDRSTSARLSKLRFVKKCKTFGDIKMQDVRIEADFRFGGFCSEYSMQLNAARITVLQAQDDLVNAMKNEASKALLRVSENGRQYKKLLKGLIVQSLLRLKEPAVLLRCREVDRKLVESVLNNAAQEYAQKADVHAPKVTIDGVYLPFPPKSSDSHESYWYGSLEPIDTLSLSSLTFRASGWWKLIWLHTVFYSSGGVVLASQDGKIVCENTLDARLDVIFRQKLPVV